MDLGHNNLHRPGCLDSIYSWNICLLPPAILDEIGDILELRTVGRPAVYRLANCLGIGTQSRWMMEDYEKQHPNETFATILFRWCSEMNKTVRELQAGLEQIDSRAAQIIPSNLQHIRDFRPIPDRRERWSNGPQQNTESFSSMSIPPDPPQFGRYPFSSPRHGQRLQLPIPPQKPHPGFGRHQPQHQYTDVFQSPCNPCTRIGAGFNLERELGCPCETCRFRDQTSQYHSAQTYDQNQINTYTDTRYEQASALQCPTSQGTPVKIPTCHCSPYTDCTFQQSCDNTSRKVLSLESQGNLSLIHGTLPQNTDDLDSHTSVDSTDVANSSDRTRQSVTASHNESPNSSTAVAMPPTDEYGVAPQNVSIPIQDTNFLHAYGGQTQTSFALHAEAVNKMYPIAYPVDIENQKAIQKTCHSGRNLHISNQSSDDDSLPDTIGLNQGKAIRRSSTKWTKVRVVSSRRVFVTGGSCREEMRKIKKELKWLEKLGVSVEWDDPEFLQVGEREWMKSFQSATLVLIGVTKNYITNMKSLTWLPRAWEINKVVQKELICTHWDNKRFRTIVFPQTGLNKVDLPAEMNIAVYCLPGNREHLEKSLRKKLNLPS